VAGAGAASLIVALVVAAAERERSAPMRCAPGLTAHRALCCGEGQKVSNGRCTGVPRKCAATMRLERIPVPGCVARNRPVFFAGGELLLSHADWEPGGLREQSRHRAGPFVIDSTEVTYARYAACVRAGRCDELRGGTGEIGGAVAGITAEQAARYCKHARGRLPTSAEWLWAAAGSEGRRYPWGATGLVCRRAAFGLIAGPCARGALGPTLAASRPDGATPQGVLDMAGNVAEWTLEADGSAVARGGSYRSLGAAELRTSAAERLSGARPDVGFRCAYDRIP
jgi:formylglycine-generating enzyme required for sulfatase activity